jgi:hypothetical protein
MQRAPARGDGRGFVVRVGQKSASSTIKPSLDLARPGYATRPWWMISAPARSATAMISADMISASLVTP